MILIVGLGNPGQKYQNNRHNIGFILLDAFAYKYQSQFEYQKKFNADIAEINDQNLYSENIILAKPQTFMNNSGEAVQKLAQFYKILPQNIWLIYDELDLEIGHLKIKKNGSGGTHNGLKSIVTHIGKDFPRFKVGIESRGLTASQLQDTASFVLSDFFEKEKDIIAESLDKTIKAIETALKEGIDQAMNKFN